MEQAAESGLTEPVSLLLASGANVHVRDPDGNTPLHLAARGGDAEVCEWLIASGADLLAANGDGSTPLHLAAAAGQVVPSMVLIAAGAPLDAKDGTKAAPSAWESIMGVSGRQDGKRPLDIATGACSGPSLQPRRPVSADWFHTLGGR